MKPKHTAVVFVELQNDCVSEGGKLSPRLKPVLEEHRVIDNLNRLIESARTEGMLIAHTPTQCSPAEEGRPP